MNIKNLSDLKCPECGECNLSSDWTHNGADAIVNMETGDFTYPNEFSHDLDFIIFTCGCGYDSYTLDEIFKANA